MRAASALFAVATLYGAPVLMQATATAAPPAPAPVAPTAPMAPRAPATPPTDSTAAKQPTLKICNKQADSKSLTGKERATFVRDCQAGKTPPEQ